MVVDPLPIVEGASHTSKMLIGGAVQHVLNPSDVFGCLELLIIIIAIIIIAVLIAVVVVGVLTIIIILATL